MSRNPEFSASSAGSPAGRTAVVTGGGHGIGATIALQLAAAGATGRSRDVPVRALCDRNPQGRLIDPREVTAAGHSLCSDAACSINGVALVLDGGELRR